MKWMLFSFVLVLSFSVSAKDSLDKWKTEASFLTHFSEQKQKSPLETISVFALEEEGSDLEEKWSSEEICSTNDSFRFYFSTPSIFRQKKVDSLAKNSISAYLLYSCFRC